MIAGSDGLELEVDGVLHRIACATLAQKRDAYAKVYWWLRSLPTNEDIVAKVSDLAQRCGVDALAICEKNCMNWNEIAES